MDIVTILMIVIVVGIVVMNILIGKSKQSKKGVNERRKRILRRYDDEE